jgi:hypothetical protein
MSNTGNNGELCAFKPEVKISSWRNDIQSLVKKCRILALLFFPQVSNRCRVSVQGGTEFTLTAALSILIMY